MANTKKEFDYYAFISYKREDKKWAEWLQKKLDNYSIPSSIGRANPSLPKKLFPIFKDTTDILPNPLEQEIKNNLERSKYLIVICSPQATKSKWVGFEIEYFISLGRADKVILFIVEGEPYSNNPQTECIHPAIKKLLPEMLGVNVNEEGKSRAFIQVVARMLEVRFDQLWQRQRRRIIRNRVMSILSATMVVALCFYIWLVNQPFDTMLTLNETTEHNSDLPFRNGVLSLVIDGDTISNPIGGYSEAIRINNIAGKYKGKEVKLLFAMRGYTAIDSAVVLSGAMQINIQRDATWSLLAGVVFDENGMAINGVAIVLDNGLRSVSNEYGEFKINIPLSKQKLYYDVKFIKEGYNTRIFKESLISSEWRVILQR